MIFLLWLSVYPAVLYYNGSIRLAQVRLRGAAMKNLDRTQSAVRDRIRELISKKGVPDQVVSREIGKSKSYISNILSGRNNPSIEALYSLFEYFEISAKDFFDFETENPMADNAIKTELKRLMGARYDGLSEVLQNLSTEDANKIFAAYGVIKNIHI